MNNCFSIIFKGKCAKLEGNLAKHEKKKMSLSLVMVQRNSGDYNAELLYSPLKIILKKIMHAQIQ